MEELDTTTPIKLRMRGDELGIATPSGGLIFNPFHKEFLSRVGQVTLSPGIFSYTASPMDNKDDSCKSTPNRFSLPFVLSPETQGMLFPADIDENPILQLKLQEKLDKQCDEDVQNSIHSFFKSHLIAPSPDTVDGTASKSHRNGLPRTSSLLPTATPKTRKKSMCPISSAPTTKSTGTQTNLTVPLDCDFEALLKKALADRNSASADVSPCDTATSTELTEPALPHFYVTTPDKDASLLPTSYSDEQPDAADDDDEAYSTGFLCTSCHQPHVPPLYSRRSLFSESSGTMDDTVNNRFDDDFPAQQTLMAAGDSEASAPNHRPSTPQPPSFKLSSTVMDDVQPDNNKGHLACSAPEGLIFDKLTSSFMDEAAAIHLLRTPMRMQSHENVFEPNPDGLDLEGNPTHVVRRAKDARASSPSPPIYGRRHGSAFRGHSMELTSINMSQDDMSFQHSHTGTSPSTFHVNMSFQSPDLSPILPAGMTRSFSPLESEDRRTERGEEENNNFLLRTPAVRLFGNPDHVLSPIPPVPVHRPILADERRPHFVPQLEPEDG